MAFGPNRTASAVVLRHPGGPRPWVIAVHGFCMGFPFMDFQGLQIARIHHELGMNVALPALPLHGPRRVTLISGEPFLSFELMNAVHGLTQTVWDIRRLLHWVHDPGDNLGQSLRRVPRCLRRLPVGRDGRGHRRRWWPASRVRASPDSSMRHSPRRHPGPVDRAQDHGWSCRERLPRRVPLVFEDPRIPVRGRFIFAGYGDRVAPSGAGATPLGALGQTSHLVVYRATTSATCGPSRRPISVASRARSDGPHFEPRA